MKIEYPSSQMRERSIQIICEKTEKKKKNTILFLIKTYHEIGLDVILKNSIVTYLLSIVIYTLILAFILVAFGNPSVKEELFAKVLLLFFFASPIMMQLSEFLYLIYELPSGVLEYKNAYKYTTYQLGLLKMPIFAVSTMIVNCTIAVCWCKMRGIDNILAPLGVIACSVFMYSLMNIAFFNHWKRKGIVGASILWLGINVVLMKLNVKLQIKLFITIPFTIHLIIAIILVIVFVKLVVNFYLKPQSFMIE
jgi:hypothetical protein